MSQDSRNTFQPKWTHFHPQSTVWVMNPFEHDVEYKVADERGTQYSYRMPAGKTSELPGGAIATLGVKAIVDEMIQNDPKDIYSMWERSVREKYENKIILRVKEAPQTKTEINNGEVNLGVGSDIEEEVEPIIDTTEQPVLPKNKKLAKVGSLDTVIEEE